MPVGVSHGPAQRQTAIASFAYSRSQGSTQASRVIAADSYVASFARGNLQSYAQFRGHDTLNISQDDNGRDPAFVGAPGKRFTVAVNHDMCTDGEDPVLY